MPAGRADMDFVERWTRSVSSCSIPTSNVLDSCQLSVYLYSSISKGLPLLAWLETGLA